MLSPFWFCPWKPLFHPIPSASMRVLPLHPPTPASPSWHSLHWGIHRALTGPKVSSPIDAQQGHPLQHMQLETWVPPCVLFGWWFSPWGLVIDIVVLPMVAKPFSSFSPFSNSSIGDPKLITMVGCQHPPLQGSSSGWDSQEAAISGSYQQALFGIPCVFFGDWVTSLRMIFSSSIHLPANFMTSLLLIDGQYSIV